MPEGYDVLWEEVIFQGRRGKVSESAETPNEAFLKAEAKVPSGSRLLEKQVTMPPVTRKLKFEAFDEQTARSLAKTQMAGKERLKSLVVVASGKRGFLGIGRKPNLYEAELFTPALVEVAYCTTAKLRVEAIQFLVPLSRAEKVEVSNLNPILYQLIIGEKRGEQPVTMVTETPGLADLLRRLDIWDLEQLAESVKCAMQVDSLTGKAAAAQCKKAADINPYNDMAVMSYGCILANEGVPWEGAMWVERAIQINPANERARRNLAAIRAMS